MLDPDVFDYEPDADAPGAPDGAAIVAAVKAAAQDMTTIGPVAPPKNFDLVAFADYIGSLRTDATTQGWVRAGADVSTIDALQALVRSQLASQSYSAARASATSYVSAVQAAACTDFDCPASKPMTAEAAALLALKHDLPAGSDPRTRGAPDRPRVHP